MPIAIGRSKLGPSFFTSAGARLIVVRPNVNVNPELISAVITRSRDSFTAASGSPTITMMVSPYPAFTSTSIGYASMPLTAAEQTLANIATTHMREIRTEFNWFLSWKSEEEERETQEFKTPNYYLILKYSRKASDDPV